MTSREKTNISVILNENEKGSTREDPVIFSCSLTESGSKSMPMSNSLRTSNDHGHGVTSTPGQLTAMGKSTSESDSCIELKRIVTQDTSSHYYSNHHHQEDEAITKGSSSPSTSSTSTSTSTSCTNSNPDQEQKQQRQQKQQLRPSPSSFEVMKKMKVSSLSLQPAQYQENISKASAALALSALYNANKENQNQNTNGDCDCDGDGNGDGVTETNVTNVTGNENAPEAMSMDAKNKVIETKDVSTTDTNNGTSMSTEKTLPSASSSSSTSSTTSSSSSSKRNSGIVSESDDDRLPSPSIPNVRPNDSATAKTAANTAAALKRGASLSSSSDLTSAVSSVVDRTEDKLSQQKHVKRQKTDKHCSTSTSMSTSVASENHPSSGKSNSNIMPLSGQEFKREGQVGTSATATGMPVPPSLPLQPQLHHSGRDTDIERGSGQKSLSSSLSSLPPLNPIDAATKQKRNHIMNSSVDAIPQTLDPNSTCNGLSSVNFIPNQGQVHSQIQMTTISTPVQQQRRSSPTPFANPDNANNGSESISWTSRTINATRQHQRNTQSMKQGYAPIYPRVNGHQQVQVLNYSTPVFRGSGNRTGSAGGGVSPNLYTPSLSNTSNLTKGHGSNSNFSKSDNGSGSNVASPNLNASLNDNTDDNCGDSREAYTITTHHHHHHGVLDGAVTPSPRHHPVTASRMGINMNMTAMSMDSVNANRMNINMNQVHANARSKSVPPSSTNTDATTAAFEQHHHHHHHHHHHVVNGLVPTNAQFITPAKSQSMKHHNHLVDMPTPMTSLEFTPNSTANINPFANGGPPSALTLSSIQLENINILGNNNGTYNRKDKSLGLLCENFIKKYSMHFADKVQEVIEECQPPPALSIDEAAKSLGVERRRIYDIINILEAIRVVSRKCKNMYYWFGLGGLTETFKCLQMEGIVNFKDDAIKNGFFVNDQKTMTYPNCGEQGENVANFQRPDNNMPSGLAMLLASAEQVQSRSKKVKMDINLKKIKSENAKEKSLAKLSQKFIQLFLVGNEIIAMNDASDKILGPTLAQSPDDFESKEEKAKIRAANSKLLKTKIRRLYDVANVLVSIGIIQKLNGGNNMSNALKHRPSFRWVYKVSPQELLKLQGRSGSGAGGL